MITGFPLTVPLEASSDCRSVVERRPVARRLRAIKHGSSAVDQRDDQGAQESSISEFAERNPG